MPDSLAGIELCFSPGVDTHWGFESDLWDKFQISSVLCDGSIERPKELEEQHIFERKWLSTQSTRNAVSLKDWVENHTYSSTGDLILQMDIEGSEYRALSATPRRTLRRFRVIVIEFHSFDSSTRLLDFLFKQSPAFRKLNRDFVSVHLHPNNCSPPFKFRDVQIPNVFEVTYIRKDFFIALNMSDRGNRYYERPRDYDCVPNNKTIALDSNWPNF